jgi:integrase
MSHVAKWLRFKEGGDMSIRKRGWTTSSGKKREAFVVDYRDAKGNRTLKTFATEKEARQFRGQVEQPGHKHVAARATPTVREAAERYLAAVEHGARRKATEPIEPATLRQYRYHVQQWIVPQFGDERIGALTEVMVQRFRDALLRKLSRGMARKVMATLKAIMVEERCQGEALDVTVGKDSKRHKEPAAIPSRSEIKAMMSVLEDKPLRSRALISTALHTGMRPSELRGLPWSAVDLKRGTIKVVQRADEGGRIGSPKSAAGRRVIDIPSSLMALLRVWKMASEHDLVFANGVGNVESLANITNRVWVPLMKAAGVKRYRLYALRHYHASALIDDGANAKEVQVEMGHADIKETFDTYGHLFQDDDAQQRRKDRAERIAIQTQHEAQHGRRKARVPAI